MSEIAQRDQRQDLVQRFREDADVRDQIRAAAPENVDPKRFVDRFTRVAVTALNERDDLMRADRRSLFNAFVKCAQMGLVPDGREATINVYGNAATLIPMIHGYVRIAGEYGWLLRTKAVYEEDFFDYTDEPQTITHRSVRPGEERGQLVAAYAVATHRDGRRLQVVFHPSDIADRRASAKTKNVWEKWPAEMWAKTAGRNLFKQLPLDPADVRVSGLIALGDLQPGDAGRLLYGSSPAVVTPAIGEVSASAEVADGGQQAGEGDGAASVSSPAPGDPEDGWGDDEPVFGEVVDEDETLEEPGAFEASPGGPGLAAATAPAIRKDAGTPGSSSVPEVSDATRALADEAAAYVPLTGKYAVGKSEGPKTLGEILAVNPGWISWALKSIESPPEYQRAVWQFASVYAREAMVAELSRREASA